MNRPEAFPPDLDFLYARLDGRPCKSGDSQPPCIGLSANLKEGLSCIAEAYAESVRLAGGAPLLIPVTDDIETLAALVERLDGLILTGGGDIHPLYQREQPIPQLGEGSLLRDRYDLTLLRLAAERQLPVFGICRGHQLINLAYGGSLYQDIYAQRNATFIQHSQQLPRPDATHTVNIREGSLLYEWLGAQTGVNSFHHQAVRETASGFEVTATSPDGLVEAMESAVPYRQIFSVQWHPETMAAAGHAGMLRLFEHLVAQARVFREAKSVHRRFVTLDSHCDTPMLFEEGVTLGGKSATGRVNLPKMFEGGIDAACIVAYIPQGPRDEEGLRRAAGEAERIIAAIKRQAAAYAETAEIAYTAADVYRIKGAGKKAFLMGIENGYALGKDLSRIGRFRRSGVVYITLCHNGDNDLCDSARGGSEWNGLSPLGKEAVREMNRTGTIVDVSHASEKTFYDVLAESRHPVIASHSSARSLCNHPRNLTDRQLKELAACGGVAQVCLYGGFLTEQEGKATIADAVRHLCYMAELVGTDHIGIGSDFDGGGGIPGCNGSNELINLTKGLLDAGFDADDLQKIWGGNFLRVMQCVQNIR